MPSAPKYIANRTDVVIDGNSTDCFAKKYGLMPEDEENDTATFCLPGARQFGTTTWTLEMDVFQSFGDGGVTSDGLHDTLSPLEKTNVPFIYKTDKTQGPSPEFPHFTGTCNVPTIPVGENEIGTPGEFTLTFPVIGPVTKVTS